MLAATSDVFITTHGASIDTVIYVRSCSCTGSEVSGGCNDDADGYTTSALRLPALAPGQYEIFIDSKAAMSASLDVHVYATAPGSESDRCGYPTPIPAGSTLISGNTCGFSADYEPVNTTGCTTAQAGDSEDRVYYFVVPSSGTVSFNGGCGSGTYDQTAFVRSICTDGTAPAQKDCNDDSGCSGPAFCNSGRFNSATSTTLSPGIYFFFADGWLSGTPACNCGPYAYSISGI
jgi:hypothetical protein